MANCGIVRYLEASLPISSHDTNFAADAEAETDFNLNLKFFFLATMAACLIRLLGGNECLMGGWGG